MPRPPPSLWPNPTVRSSILQGRRVPKVTAIDGIATRVRVHPYDNTSKHSHQKTRSSSSLMIKSESPPLPAFPRYSPRPDSFAPFEADTTQSRERGTQSQSRALPERTADGASKVKKARRPEHIMATNSTRNIRMDSSYNASSSNSSDTSRDTSDDSCTNTITEVVSAARLPGCPTHRCHPSHPARKS